MISEELKKLREKVALLIEKVKNSKPKGDAWEYLSTLRLSPNAETGDTLEVVIPKYCTSLNSAFAGTSKVRPKYKTLIISKPDEAEYPVTSMGALFNYNTTVRDFYMNINTSHVTDISQQNGFFDNNCLVRNIYGEFDCSSFKLKIQRAFSNQNLQRITFVPKTIFSDIIFDRSPDLLDESIQSIIDGLAPVETAQTLTFHSTVKEKLTEEQIAKINEKGWTLA